MFTPVELITTFPPVRYLVGYQGVEYVTPVVAGTRDTLEKSVDVDEDATVRRTNVTPLEL